MVLTRRGTITALLGGGIASAVTLAGSELIVRSDVWGSDRPITDAETATLVAVADVVYPSDVTDIEEFVTGYVRGLDEEHQTKIAETARDLDRFSRRRHGKPYGELSVTDRDVVLRSMGVNRVQPDPRGTLPERVRFYLVHETMYALLTNPKGARLFGYENPVGYPGGFSSHTVEL